ncbi:MAG: bifunctional DNA primase/polymerase [Chloroflexi bacterium]|nr:bifunctional DNA primase/polymerase [Chloroflexota bacterium]
MAAALEAALSYASRGWRVFTLVPRGKTSFADSSGLYAARTDEAQVRRWWRDVPHPNIGIVTEGAWRW